MRTQIFAVAIALTPLASAIAWPAFLPDLDAIVVRRQDDSETIATPTTSPKTTNTADPEQSTTAKTTAKTTTTKGPITTDLNTAGNDEETSGTVKTTGTKSNSKTSGTSSPTFNVLDPAGGASMVTPSAIAGTPLYKIEGTPIKWVWNYTSVQGKPSAIDVLISCSTASQTITLTQNMTYKNPQTFTWDAAAYDETALSNRLLNEKYTLIVYDADGSPTMTAAAGYLQVFNSFRFGLYHKQDYKDLDEWNCATCNAGQSIFDRKAMGFVVWMSIVTVLSFTWFVGGLGALL